MLIASGDRDTFQLASNRTTILYPVRAGEMARVDPAEVRARYGVDPAQVPDFIALRGDPSDKLPGAPGVGASGAATLLQRYGSLEAALKAGRFPAQAEELAALPSDRHDGPESAAAEPSESDANLEQGGCIGAEMGVESARPPARRFCCGVAARMSIFEESMESGMAETRKARAVGFNHVALAVGDIEEALAFYGRLFDYELRGKKRHLLPSSIWATNSLHCRKVELNLPTKDVILGLWSTTARSPQGAGRRRDPTATRAVPRLSRPLGQSHRDCQLRQCSIHQGAERTAQHGIDASVKERAGVQRTDCEGHGAELEMGNAWSMRWQAP